MQRYNMTLEPSDIYADHFPLTDWGDGDHYTVNSNESPTGKWVTWDDAHELIMENARLRTENARLRKGLPEFNEQ